MKKHQAGKKGIIFQNNGDGTVFHRLKQAPEQSLQREDMVQIVRVDVQRRRRN